MKLTLSYAKGFLRRQGMTGPLRLLLYPLSSLVWGPVQLLRTLARCGPLLGKNRGHYAHFNPALAVSSLFYWNADLNLSRFGRKGLSPYLGDGSFPLSQGFHYCRLSLLAYRKAGALTVLLGMGAWCLSHLVWLESSGRPMTVAVLFLLGTGSFFFAQTFLSQTYHVLGWVFFPLGLFGILTDRPLIAGAAWFLASLGSSTAALLGGIFAVSSEFLGHPGQVLAFLPAGLKLASHGLILSGGPRGLENLSKVAGMIGSRKTGVRYRRPALEWTVRDQYLLGAAALYLACDFFLNRVWAWPLALGILLLACNSFLVRFADEQSPQMVLLTAAAAWTLAHPDWRLLPFLWLLACPPPALFRFKELPSFDRLPVCRPFSVRPLLDGVRGLLAPLPLGARVLMAFEDPGGEYKRIFDGYRGLVELPSYVGTEKGFLLMPNWWMIMQWNRPGDPGFWGRDAARLTSNMEKWKADYALAYQAGGEREPDWRGQGFEVLGLLDWASIPEARPWLPGDKAGSAGALSWTLLRRVGSGS